MLLIIEMISTVFQKRSTKKLLVMLALLFRRFNIWRIRHQKTQYKMKTNLTNIYILHLSLKFVTFKHAQHLIICNCWWIWNSSSLDVLEPTTQIDLMSLIPRQWERRTSATWNMSQTSQSQANARMWCTIQQATIRTRTQHSETDSKRGGGWVGAFGMTYNQQNASGHTGPTERG